ncbi:unnamed protein product [Kluyveromyces dobzhanskii CBS 2104]|uniref:WGS project CCBQ000000000 data, contig MAT n=1 Tax=Kluyveromyces dobzhanskii CBS 2104 TaxID=1427455 RepID=A0A0A8L3F0_9SACH|nr:unnamed protein product [Kluyveromyces dobzhanskii CBS 2104]
MPAFANGTYSLKEYHNALNIKTGEEILNSRNKSSRPRSVEDYSKEIEHNGYVRNQLAEKLVALYTKDVGDILKEVYAAQKQASSDLTDKFREMYLTENGTSDQALHGTDCDKQDLVEAYEYLRDISKPQLKCYPGTPEWKKWQNAIEIINLKKTILLCVDLEAFERDTNIVTEIGITIYDPRENFDHSVLPLTRSFHFCIEEAYDLRNGRFVDDAKDNFLFDDSKILPLDDVVTSVQSLINKYLIPHNEAEHTWKRALVGHGVSGDISWLESLNIKLPKNVQILDTLKLYECMYGKQSSLKRMLSMCKIPFAYLHNAGNDSYFTLQLLLSLCDIGTRIKLHLDDWYYVKRLDEKLYQKEQAEKQKVYKKKGNKKGARS